MTTVTEPREIDHDRMDRLDRLEKLERLERLEIQERDEKERLSRENESKYFFDTVTGET